MIYTASARTTALTSAGQLDNPFVAYDNLMAAATLGGTTTLTDGAAANAVTGTTYDYWLPDISATTAILTADFGSAVVISFAALAAHNLSDLGGSVQVQNSADGISWSNAGVTAITPTDNTPIAFRLSTSATAKQYWRFAFAGLTAGDPLYVGVAFLGDDLVMPTRFYGGFAPVLTPTEVQLQSNVSVGGNLLGSSIVSRGSTLAASFRHITAATMRSDILPMIRQFNTGSGFFFGWRPSTFDEDVHYCWRDGDVARPANDGGLDYMSFTMQMRVFEA